MLKKIFGALWPHMPKSLRRLGVRLSEASFTVTTAAIVRDQSGRVLLLNHAFRTGSGWGIPGGFINKGEQPEEAIRRELREEVGLELEAVELVSVRTLRQVDQVEILFRCRSNGAAEPRSVEIKSAAWFALDSLPQELSHGQRQLIERALKARG